MQLTDEALAEWRGHPVTEYVRAALGKSLSLQRDQCKEAAWAGVPWPEEKRLALVKVFEVFGDLFDASADDFEAMTKLEFNE